MPKYELIYFNARGRAELPRMILKQGGIDFQDTRLTQEEWAKIKDSTPFGQAPVLKVDGVFVAQSGAITRYVAKQAGLTGANDLEAAHIDQWMCAFDDVFAALMPVMMAMFQEKPDEAMKLLPDINKKTIQPFLERLGKAKEAGGEWLVGSKVSYVDLAAYNFIKQLAGMDKKNTVEPHCPKLHDWIERIGNLPKIKEWIESRPETKF